MKKATKLMQVFFTDVTVINATVGVARQDAIHFIDFS